MIPTFKPTLQVTLKKVQRRRGADRVSYLSESFIPAINLTPHLGDNGGVTTHRGLDQPAGTFSLTLSDRMDARGLDSMYATIEPMDVVEIRMAGSQITGLPTMVMRGFVSNVSRHEVMGQDGRPNRTVTVSGHDFGKILQIMQISYQKEYLYGNFLLSAFPMFEQYGLWFHYPAGEFVRRVIDGLVSKVAPNGKAGFLRELTVKSGLEEFIEFGLDAVIGSGYVGPYGMSHYEGDVWRLLSNWCDLDWNELFVEDREDAAYVVFRPKPYYKLGTDELVLADDGAVRPDEHTVDIADVESLSLARADQHVANFYQVDAPEAEMLDLEMAKAQAMQEGRVIVTDHRNCDPGIYGLKIMSARTNQGPLPMQMQADVAGKHGQVDDMGLWYNKRREDLRALNQDNVVYEDGSMTIRGRAEIRPGQYIRLRRGQTVGSRYYVTHVTHQFTPFQSFKTTLQVARGEGYIDRLGKTGSPYLAEGRQGVY